MYLGDEAAEARGMHHQDVQPGDVVGHDQHRAGLGRDALDPQGDAQRAQHAARPGADAVLPLRGRQAREQEDDGEPAARHLGQHAHALAQLGADLRRRFDQGLEKRTEPGELGVEDGADAQRAAHRVVQRGGGLAKVAQRHQGLVGQRQQRRAVLGEGHALGRAGEQGQAGGLGQRLELQAHRRLGAAQQLSGLGEAPQIDHRQIGAQHVRGQVDGGHGGIISISYQRIT